MKKILRILGTALAITALAAPVAFAGRDNESYGPRYPSIISKAQSQAEMAAAETARMKNHLDNIVREILNTRIGNTH